MTTSAVRVGARAARTLVTELARRPGPKTGLLVSVSPGSPVLTAAIDALLPEDSLTVVAPDPAELRAYLAGLGSWVGDRVRVADSLAAAEPAEVVVLAEPLSGTAEQARATLAELTKLLAAGGVASVAAVAVPALAPGAVAELDRQSMLYGVGTDLVLRNLPGRDEGGRLVRGEGETAQRGSRGWRWAWPVPLRVHKLCWNPAGPELADRLTPADRPSSVPLTSDLHIDSHGVAAAGIALGLAAAAKLARRRSKLWLLPAAAALPVAAFFRDPRREPAEQDGSLVLAASDGTVLSVERVSDDRFTEDGSTADYLRIAVFLSVLDVHINRTPVPGRVVDYFLEDGGYAAAMTPAGEHNVAAYTVLQTTRGRVVVAQRTGLLARRIVQRAPVGSLLARGERFGLIRFGSRTDVYLPVDAAENLVAVGDRVLGGATPLARWR